MASTILSDNGVSSGSAGLKSTAGNDGVLILQTTTSGGTATTAVTIDTSQNVGIGTSSPSQKLEIYGSQTTPVSIKLRNDNGATTGGTSLVFGNYAGTDVAYLNSQTDGSNFNVKLWNASGYLAFGAANQERMRIDSSGNLLVGTTTSPGSGASGLLLRNAGGTFGNIVAGKTASGTVDLIANYYNSTYVGGITYSNTATALVASSDLRLKENVVEAGSAVEKVKAIKVVSYDWKHDDSHVEFGLVAQQLNTIYPEAVNAGDDGDEIEKTWGIEYGRLTPLLLKAIQEQQALITSLTERIAALEGAQQ
jgi:hypothetical protein